MAKTKLEKHLEELEESTSGGSHDAVTFAGKGLDLLKSFLGKNDKKDREEDEEDEDLLEDEEDEEEEDEKPVKKSRRTNKNEANGGDLEEEDEDEDDPGQDGEEDIITNKGKRVKGAGAVKKNARDFDERRFEKHFDSFEEEYDDVLDASPALGELTKHIRSLAKSSTSKIAKIHEQNVLLGKAVRELLKSNAALAADLELVKKQPAGTPATGFVVLNKGEEGGKGRKLRKSDIQDIVTDAMNEGLVDSRTVSSLRSKNTEAELRDYVDGLPTAVRDRL